MAPLVEETRGERNVTLRTLSSHERGVDYAGGGSARRGKSDRTSKEHAAEPAVSDKTAVFRVTVAKPRIAKKARELERSFGEPVLDHGHSRLLHGSSNQMVSVLLPCHANHSKRWSVVKEAGDETGEAKGNQAAGTNTSRTQKPTPPRKRSKAS